MQPNYNLVIPLTKTAMTLLAHRVPITLLADLLDPSGPPSREIYRTEAVADDVQREFTSLAATATQASQPASEAKRALSDFTTSNAAC